MLSQKLYFYAFIKTLFQLFPAIVWNPWNQSERIQNLQGRSIHVHTLLAQLSHCMQYTAWLRASSGSIWHDADHEFGIVFIGINDRGPFLMRHMLHIARWLMYKHAYSECIVFYLLIFRATYSGYTMTGKWRIYFSLLTFRFLKKQHVNNFDGILKNNTLNQFLNGHV